LGRRLRHTPEQLSGGERHELTARHVNVMGISSQPLEVQYRGAKANQLTQTLLTDPECRLAQALELPTFTLEGARWYRRLTLLVSAGRINKVFFPVCAARNADQVLAWMKVQAGHSNKVWY
jgi:peroxiredoxin